MDTQTELLETISGFVDHFQSQMTTLSPPQMHALLDHLQTRCSGGQALLDAIQRGETSTRPKSFLQNSPSQLLLDFYDALPDHQINIQKGLTALSHFKIEVDNAAVALRSQLTVVCSNPALMLYFKPSVQGITTIDLTQEETLLLPQRTTLIIMMSSQITLAVFEKSLGPTQLVQLHQVQV